MTHDKLNEKILFNGSKEPKAFNSTVFGDVTNRVDDINIKQDRIKKSAKKHESIMNKSDEELIAEYFAKGGKVTRYD